MHDSDETTEIRICQSIVIHMKRIGDVIQRFITWDAVVQFIIADCRLRDTTGFGKPLLRHPGSFSIITNSLPDGTLKSIKHLFFLPDQIYE
jgi:hypothetical protein